MTVATIEDREWAIDRLMPHRVRKHPADRDYNCSAEHWIDDPSAAGAGWGTAELVAQARAEGAVAALADPERVIPAFEALCKAEGARTIQISCGHGKLKVYLDGPPSLRAAWKLRKREEARRG